MQCKDFTKIIGAKTYDSFYQTLSQYDCQRCGLGKDRTQIVIHRGDPSAKIVFVGEAPGAQEDATGKPFVGRAGKMLDACLRAAGFDIENDLFIMNVVKCRPPKNRVPTLEEATSCRPFLERQLKLVRPCVIGLLGATALKHLAPEVKKKAMKDTVGQILPKTVQREFALMVLYHPAALLYDPSKKSIFLRHLKKMRQQFGD